MWKRFSVEGRLRGFTLIELMVTIAVLAILVALAAPALNQVEQRRVIGAAEEMLANIQLARTEAIKQSQNVFFVADDEGTDGWCHGISSNPGCDCWEGDAASADACTLVLAGDEEPALFRTTSDGVRNINMTGAAELEFNSVRGTVVGLAPAAIDFSSTPNGFQMRVEVSRIGRPGLCGPARAMGAYRQCD